KFLVAGTFVVPVLMYSLDHAIVISVIWGLFLLTALSIFVARVQSISAWRVVGEHVVIALCVVVITHLVGAGIQKWAE
ncbi:MAG: hypothetical protein OEY86_16575, partial [Nitrospira sp.]|nr:hypothetical protein [Nitrospira sp.]